MHDIFNSIIGESLTLRSFLICTAVSLVLGTLAAAIGTYRSRSSGGFAVTIAVLPAIVQVVIMLVNGNIGAGVAVAGAFSLVFFRSVAGTAKEIGVIFLAMTIGLATGMGYVGPAALFFIITAAFMLLLTRVDFCSQSKKRRILKITIPEDLDYEGIFDDIFNTYTSSATLEKVKTTNMGTLYELEYSVILKDEQKQKPFIDAIRCRNGNLNIVCSRKIAADSL